MTRAVFKIRGMDCAEEVKILKKEVGSLPGVLDLTFDILNARMTVRYDPARTDPSVWIAAVDRTGMKAEPWSDQPETLHRHRWTRTILTATSGGCVLLGFLVHTRSVGFAAALGFHEAGMAEPAISWIARLLYLIAIATGGWLVVPKAVFALRRFRPDMNLLMTIAVLGAVGIGQWLEGATVAFLFALSLALESWSVRRARRAVAALMELSPPKARIYCPHDRQEETVDVDRVAVGTTVIVKPGEKFPLDGRITRGETTVNQAPITGESLPVAKTIGDEVFAGSINEDGAVEFESTRPASDTTLARVIRMVGEAQGRRAPSELWVETFAKYYTPLVMGLAVAVAVLPPLLFNAPWSDWFYRALVLLVIACPCALVISTPVSIVAGLASAARHGVLIKGGRFLEIPARLRAIAIDKTGTLTEGHPRVLDMVPSNDHTPQDLLRIAAALESRSQHPIARAVLHHAAELGIEPIPADDVRAVRGKGAVGRIDGREYWIGSHRYLHERGQYTPEMHEQLEALSSSGITVVAMGTDDHVCGFLTVADRVRPEAAGMVQALGKAGIEHVVMITGDNRETAAAIARETGMESYRAELLPEDKVQAIESLVKEYKEVGMIGDGVNDAPAMARSSLGIAMGAAGSDAAIETADIALMSDDLSRIPWLIAHSRRTVDTIRINITVSIGIKAVFVALTFLGYATLWAAIAADMGVSLLVVLNALRLLNDPHSG